MHPLLQRFLKVVPLQAGALLEAAPSSDRALTITLSSNGETSHLKAVPLTRPYGSALNRLLADDPTVDIIITDHIPKGLPEAARQSGVGYLDVMGGGRVEAHNLHYEAPIAPRTRLERRSSPFAPQATRAVRSLLCHGAGHVWRLGELAAEAHLDAGNLRRVLVSLMDSRFIERDGEAYVLVDPGGLLDAWAQNRRIPDARLTLPLAGDELESQIRRLQNLFDPDSFIVSGELAAERYAPFFSASRTLLHCTDPQAWEELRHWAAAEEGPQDPGGVLSIDPADADVGRYGREMNGLMFASPVQTYVDLRMGTGRAFEAAQHLRSHVVGF